MRVAFIPIDNRPVCYTLPQLISQVDESFELLLPPREYLGDLTKQANIQEIFEWMHNLQAVDAIVLSLDTLAYGGLILSRRCPEKLTQISSRINDLKDILLQKHCKIYAFSSIMRISNNNYNEEEKSYWAQYGKKIFEYSFNMHKYGIKPSTDIPEEILQDYLETRKRNFEINKIYLEWQKEGLLNKLIFSKDDCAEFGFNVQEALELEKLGGYIKTGADEIPLSLLSCAISGNIRVCPVFTEPEYKHLISNYEDISIEQSVLSQLELAGCEIVSEDEADIIIVVNNFKNHQGELVMNISTESYSKQLKLPQKPYMIADVRFANGSDNNFVKALFDNNIFNDKNFYGYAAWNTSANTLGSLICAAKMRFLSERYNECAFKRLQMTRFLDDWAYQANVRQTLLSPDIQELTVKMKTFENIMKEYIMKNIEIKYSFPWERIFEVEIEFI